MAHVNYTEIILQDKTCHQRCTENSNCDAYETDDNKCYHYDSINLVDPYLSTLKTNSKTYFKADMSVRASNIVHIANDINENINKLISISENIQKYDEDETGKDKATAAATDFRLRPRPIF